MDGSAKLRITEQRLRLAVETAQLATWELNPEDGQLIADSRCLALHGLPVDPTQLALELLLDRIEPDHRDKVRTALRSGSAFEVEYPVTTASGGAPQWLLTRGQAVTTESGPRVIAAVLDISVRHRQEEAIQKQAEFYQQLVGIVSHDLKNPIQVMLAGLSLLEDGGKLTDKQQNVMRRVKNATDRAGRLISDLLDFTRDRLGDGIPVQPGRADLMDVVNNVVSGIAILRPTDKIEVERSGDTTARIDADRMEQMLTNLVDNAFEYGNEGEPIRLSVAGHPDRVEISVSAHGDPIASDQIARLFEPLSPAVRDRNRRRVGLGLYIVRAIAESHDGTAEVSSTERETRFVVTLPRLGPARKS